MNYILQCHLMNHGIRWLRSSGRLSPHQIVKQSWWLWWRYKMTAHQFSLNMTKICMSSSNTSMLSTRIPLLITIYYFYILSYNIIMQFQMKASTCCIANKWMPNTWEDCCSCEFRAQHPLRCTQASAVYYIWESVEIPVAQLLSCNGETMIPL